MSYYLTEAQLLGHIEELLKIAEKGDEETYHKIEEWVQKIQMSLWKE